MEGFGLKAKKEIKVDPNALQNNRKPLCGGAMVNAALMDKINFVMKTNRKKRMLHKRAQTLAKESIGAGVMTR